MTLPLLFIAIGVATFMLRGAFILRRGDSAVSRYATLERLVPVVALTALVVPSLLPHPGEPSYARAAAAAVGAGVAWRTKNVLATVVAGILALALLG